MTNPTPTDWRALCAVLTDDLEEWVNGYLINDPADQHTDASFELIDRVRAALSQPEAQGPTQKEAVSLYSEVMAAHDCQTLGEMAEHFARAVLARWGTPANTINQENYEG